MKTLARVQAESQLLSTDSATAAPLLAGQRLPELPALTAAGVPTLINAYLGDGVTLLSFLHGTWCADCVRQIYSLQRSARELAVVRAKVVVIVQDRVEALAGFLMSARPPLPFMMLADPTGAAHRRVGAGGQMFMLVVGPPGMVLRHWHLGDQSSASGLPELLDQLRSLWDDAAGA